MAKRLNVKQVESELRLILLGADGGEIDDGLQLPATLTVEAIQRVYYAIISRWFPQNRGETNLGRMAYFDSWASVEKLAAFIVSERKRLDAKGEA